MPTWRRIQDARAGFLFHLSEPLALLDCRYPGLLEPVTDGPMVVASDYSGQHKGAVDEAYSFLVTTQRAMDRWEAIREAFRSRWLPDGRRISFKQLREPVRWRALLPFLNAASAIRGNMITFLIDARVGSFMEGGAGAIADAFPDCFSAETKQGTIEKMFRLSSLLALLIAGLRRKDQRSVWVSDSDETLEAFDRRERFAQLTSYLTFGLTRWRKAADMEFGTTASPYAAAWAEDVAAIPDLVAGACCKLSRLLPTFCGTELWTRAVHANDTEDRRTRSVGNWMATTRGDLRHVLLRLAPDQDGDVRASAQFFLGNLSLEDPYGMLQK